MMNLGITDRMKTCLPPHAEISLFNCVTVDEIDLSEAMTRAPTAWNPLSFGTHWLKGAIPPSSVAPK
jgi:hypothetical protein